MKRNKKLQKIVATILLCTVAMVSVPLVTLAETSDIYDDSQQSSARLTYISAAETDLSINGTVATVDCWVKGNTLNATKAKVIAELQVKNSPTNWIPVAIWTDTQNGYRASVYETKTINPDNTYRVKATYTVWEGSQSETITVFTDEV